MSHSKSRFLTLKSGFEMTFIRSKSRSAQRVKIDKRILPKRCDSHPSHLSFFWLLIAWLPRRIQHSIITLKTRLKLRQHACHLISKTFQQRRLSFTFPHIKKIIRQFRSTKRCNLFQASSFPIGTTSRKGTALAFVAWGVGPALGCAA